MCHEFKRLEMCGNVNHCNVIVLGGGLSGLGAATVLKDNSVNFLLLEGQDRVGGRANTVEMLDTKEMKSSSKVLVENGAQWIHGKLNELYEVASKLDLIRPELSEEAEGDYIREDGYKFDDLLIKKIDFMVGQILTECEELVKKKNDGNFEFPESMENYLLKKFQLKIQSLATERERDLAYQLLDWHRRFQIIDNSCNNLNELSAKCWGNYSFNGESCQTHINIRGGLSQIPNHFFKQLKDNIQLNKKVDRVVYDESSKKFFVQCSDQSIFSCDNLICTFSIGVLKHSHKDMFFPQLPTKQTRVIESIGFGGIGKIFLHFDEKWWKDGWKGLQLIWKDLLNEVKLFSKSILFKSK